MFADYYKQHDKFLADNRDGWQTVGDIAYRDDEGFLYICDRKKDMIISGGMNIYPAEIEAALELHPDDLRGGRVRHPERGVGRDGARRGRDERRDATLTDDEVVAHARAHLAAYKIPRSISFVDELPKTGSGKILKRELRARTGPGMARWSAEQREGRAAGGAWRERARTARR